MSKGIINLNNSSVKLKFYSMLVSRISRSIQEILIIINDNSWYDQIGGFLLPNNLRFAKGTRITFVLLIVKQMLIFVLLLTILVINVS